MNVKRFTARTSRDALSLVRQALGDDAVVLSTKPSAGGVEVLAMAPEGMHQVERLAAKAPVVAAPVEEDVAKLSMSTLSFQDYVRERLLRRRQNALKGGRDAEANAQESRFGESMPGLPAKAAVQRRAEPMIEPASVAAAVAPVAPVAPAPVAAPASVLEQRMNERAPMAASLPPQRDVPLPRAAHEIHVPGLADD